MNYVNQKKINSQRDIRVPLFKTKYLMFIEILKYASLSFANFFTVFLILGLVIGLPCTLIAELWADLLKLISVIKNGYPPVHCNALGELRD